MARPRPLQCCDDSTSVMIVRLVLMGASTSTVRMGIQNVQTLVLVVIGVVMRMMELMILIVSVVVKD